MGSWVARVVGSLLAIFQLVTPFRSRLRVSHRTDRPRPSMHRGEGIIIIHKIRQNGKPKSHKVCRS